MVSDFAPGKDAEMAFQESFKKAGGEIVGHLLAGRRSGQLKAICRRINTILQLN